MPRHVSYIRAAHASLAFLMVVLAATGAMSLVVATYFTTIGCDPIRTGQISSANQVQRIHYMCKAQFDTNHAHEDHVVQELRPLYLCFRVQNFCWYFYV